MPKKISSALNIDRSVFTLMAQLGTLYYYAFFLVIMPVLGLVETPRRIPNSITEAVLEKTAKA